VPATDLLAALRAAGARLAKRNGRVVILGAPRTLRPQLMPVATLLGRLYRDRWRLDLATWPDWRRHLYEERAAIREYDGRQPRDLAERCAYLEAAEAPEEPAPLLAPPLSAPPANDVEAPAVDLGELAASAPTLALLLEAFPGARIEVRPCRRPPVETPEEPAEAPQGFVHTYRTPSERPALPLFRWSTLPPATRSPSPRPPTSPPGAIEAPREPPAGPVHGPRELPERRAARLGYRIDAHGSWLEPGEASRAPHLARFAVGREPSEGEREAHRAQLDAIEADGAARLGPLRGDAPLSEPSPDVLPERAATWREAYQRRLGAGLDPGSRSLPTDPARHDRQAPSAASLHLEGPSTVPQRGARTYAPPFAATRTALDRVSKGSPTLCFDGVQGFPPP
jgi:hypothetical protein